MLYINSIKNYLISTFYFVVIIINIAVVTIVYYSNYVTANKLDETSSLSPQKLCERLYESRRMPPEAFTYDKLPNGKYVLYRLNIGDSLYRRSVEDYPVDVDGHQWIPNNEENSKITYTKTGFTVPGIPNELACPFRWYWDQKQSKCVESPLCPRFDNSILPLLNAYYTEITNPATTMLTKLTDKVIHKKLYIQCMRNERKPMIKACSENTFVKMSTEKFDENNIAHIPPLENGEPNVDAFCKRYDVCEHRLNGSVHRLLINDSDGPLEADEFYICKEGRSVKKKCSANHRIDPNLEPTSGHVCVPVDPCNHHRDYYFRIDDFTYGFCQSNVQHIVSCDKTGIFEMPDESIECRNQECLDPPLIINFTYSIFDYAVGVKTCMGGNTPKVLSCDEMFSELTKSPILEDIYLPRTKINDNLDNFYDFGDHRDQKKPKEYFEDEAIMLPTRFYYDREKGECMRFPKNGIKEFLITKKMVKADAVIYKSTSERVQSLPFNFITDQMQLDPKKFGYKEGQKIYAVYNGKIYRTDDNLNGIEWDNSENYYSFIYPIAKEPKKIPQEKLIGKMYDDIDGIYYALCIKHESKLEISGSSTSLETELESLRLNCPDLNFPRNHFSENQRFVGKYFYDENTKNIVIWHDYLFVIKVLLPNWMIKHKVDTNGQFIVDDFVSDVISIIYNAKLENWNETALVTTFNYSGRYFENPVPYWLSFINIQDEELTTKNLLNYFKIEHPIFENDEVRARVLKSIIDLQPLKI